MSDFAKAVEAMTTLWPKGNPTAIEATALLQTALPHLRRLHFQEAAEALEREGDLLGDAQTNFRWAAAFLRGVQ